MNVCIMTLIMNNVWNISWVYHCGLAELLHRLQNPTSRTSCSCYILITQSIHQQSKLLTWPIWRKQGETEIILKYTNPAYRHSDFCKPKLTAPPSVPTYFSGQSWTCATFFCKLRNVPEIDEVPNALWHYRCFMRTRTKNMYKPKKTSAPCHCAIHDYWSERIRLWNRNETELHVDVRIGGRKNLFKPVFILFWCKLFSMPLDWIRHIGK